jgi:hypothetical protein
MNDSHVLSTDEGLPAEVCAPQDRATVREICALLIPLRQSVDPAEGLEFQEMVAGKSAAFEAMQRRLSSDPTKRKAYAERVDKALEELLANDDAFRLLPKAQHTTLAMIRQHAANLRNPD